MAESRNRDIARFLGKTEANNPGNVRLTSTADGSGLVVYANKESLPSTGLTSGDQAFVTATSRFYISNGSGWYNVAMINATPTLSISPSGAIQLATDGSTPTVVTLTAADSDNAVAGLTLTVESDGNFGGLATLSQDSSVFTITPKAQNSATQTNSTLTFKASDGINIASGTTAFSLTFEADWTGGFTLVKDFDEASASANAQFGSYTMDITPDGTRLMVCAREDDDANGDNIGAVYI